MPLFSRGQWLIGLSPQAFSGLHYRGRRCLERHYQALPAERLDDWEPAMRELENFLKGRHTRGGKLRIILSQHFLYFAQHPWSDALLRPRQTTDYLAEVFKIHYGTRLAGWRHSYAPPRRNEACLACSMDPALYKKLEETARRAQLTLEQVTPWISAALDRFQRHLRSPDCHFATVEPGLITLATVQRRRVRALDTCTYLDDWTEALASFQQRLALRREQAHPLPTWYLVGIDPALAVPAAPEKLRLLRTRCPQVGDPTEQLRFALPGVLLS